MATDAQIRRRVMRRVYTMYYMRLVSKPVPRAAIFAVLFFAMIGSISIVNVFANAINTSSLAGLFNFVVSAFANTSATVQFLAVALALWVGWFAFDTAQNLELVTLDPKEVA